MPKDSGSDRAQLLKFARDYLNMRRCQKNYFRSKSVDHLEESKRREQELDQRAKQILDLTPSLFDLPPASDPHETPPAPGT